MKFEIEFAQCVRDHFKYLKANERARILEALERQLAFEPLKETRNRKPLRPNPLAPWELRIVIFARFTKLPWMIRTWCAFWQLAKRRRSINNCWKGIKDMKTLEISEASGPLSALTHDLDKEMIVLTSNDKPVAAIVSLKNVDKESLALSSSSEFMEIIDAARKEFAVGKTVSLEEMKREFLPEKKKRKR